MESAEDLVGQLEDNYGMRPVGQSGEHVASRVVTYIIMIIKIIMMMMIMVIIIISCYMHACQSSSHQQALAFPIGPQTAQISSVQFSSVQFKMVSVHSGRPICAPPHLTGVSPMLPLKRLQCWSD